MAEQKASDVYKLIKPMMDEDFGPQLRRVTQQINRVINTVTNNTSSGNAALTALNNHIAQEYDVAHGTDATVASVHHSAHYGIVGGIGVDETAKLSAMINDVGLAGGGKIIVRAATNGDPIQIDGLASIYHSNIDLEFLSPVRSGAGGGIRAMGAMTEYVVAPATFAGGLATGSPASEGDTTITLSTTAGKMQASHYSVGMLITLRGENDPTGRAYTKQQVVITSINTGANTLTFAQELEYDFEPLYPLSEYSPTDATTIFPNLTWALTANIARGDMTATVASTTGMVVGRMARLYDGRVEVDLNPAAIRSSLLPYENECRLEYITITAIDTGTNTVTFDRPVSKDYLFGAPYYGGIADVEPVENVHIRGVNLTYYEPQTSKNAHAISLNFTRNSTIENCNIDGSGGGMGQQFRISDSLNSWVLNCNGVDPAYHESGQGYLFTNYKSDRSGFRHCMGRGGRHNFLMQACTNFTVDSSQSFDAWISGIDTHGVDEYDGLIVNCQMSQMNNHPSDASNGACLRNSNTSHYVGTHWLTVLNCVFFGNYETNIAGIDFLAACSHFIIDGCKFYGGYYGIKNSKNPSQCSPPTPITDVIIRNCDFYNITNRPIYLEGVPDTAGGTRSSSNIAGILIEGCTTWNCTQHIHITGGDAITSLTISECQAIMPVTSPANDYYGLDLSDVAGLMVRNNNFHLCSRGISLTDATNACIIGNTLTATIDVTPITLAGTNTGPGGGALIYVANIVDNSSIASTSTAFTTNVSVTNAQPEYSWNEPDAGADEKIWRAVTAAGDWYLQLLTDLGVATTNAILVQRAGTAVSAITLNGATTITGALTLSGGITGTLAGYLLADGTIPLSADWDAGLSRRIKARIIQARDSNGFGIYESSGTLGLNILNSGDVTGSTGKYIAFRTLQALDVNGLSLLESSGASGLHVLNSGNLIGTTGKYLAVRTLRALDANGLDICDDAGNLAIYVEDSTAAIGFGTGSPASGVKTTTDGEVRVRQAGNTRYYGSHVVSGGVVTHNTWDSTGGVYIPMNLDASVLSINANFNGWTALPYATDWLDYGTSNSAGRYRKIGDMVFLEGIIKRTPGSSSITIGTLPSGFRPTDEFLVGVDLLATGTYYQGRIDISTGGVITLALVTLSGSSVSLGTTTIGYLILNNISFSTL